MNFINYLSIALSLSFVYSSERSLSGFIFNPDQPDVRYDHRNQALHFGWSNYSLPIPKGLEDARWVGGDNNISILRTVEENGFVVNFGLMAGTRERNMIFSDRTSLCNNQNIIVGGWGIYSRSEKILVAWVESLITAKNQNEYIKEQLPNGVLEMVEKNRENFDITVCLKVFDLVPQNSGNPALSPRGPVSIPIEGFPFDYRVRLFPFNILFSPDGKNAIVPTALGFVLCPLLIIFPPLSNHVFSFVQAFKESSDSQTSYNSADVAFDSSEEFINESGQFFAFKWVTENRFLVLGYTRFCITKFLLYSKSNYAWCSDNGDTRTINELNERIESFGKTLLHLRFDGPDKNDKTVSILAIFLGLSYEQFLAKINT
jgi:hypothetical protein